MEGLLLLFTMQYSAITRCVSAMFLRLSQQSAAFLITFLLLSLYLKGVARKLISLPFFMISLLNFVET